MENPVSSSRARYCFVLFLLFLISQRSPLAGDWSVVPSVYVAGSYYDNIFLSSPGSELSDSVLQVNPSITVDGKGRRGDVSLNYVMQNVYYDENVEFNDTYHILNARGNAELFPELFFIDATLGRTQQTISRDAGIPLDNITISTNRTNVDVVSVSPFLRTNVGDKLTTEVRYTGAWTRYDRDVSANFRNEAVYADLRNDLTSSRAQWGIVYRNRKFDYDIRGNYTYERAYVDVDYSATGQLGLLASGGYENNGYNRQGLITRAEKGETWDIGLRWNPVRQNTISIRLGERVFGKTKSLRFRYFTRRWTWTAAYDEEFENNLGILVRNQQNNATGGEMILPGDPTPTTEAYLSRDFNFRARRRYGKTDIDFSVYDRKREFQLTYEEEQLSGTDVNFEWRFQRRTSFLLGMQAENQNLRNDANNNYLVIATIGLNRAIFRGANLQFNFRHYRRDMNNPALNSYRQNQVKLDLNVVF